ncbi:hypothetical protein QOT17_009926 [Balamuthia mandrillaris]
MKIAVKAERKRQVEGLREMFQGSDLTHSVIDTVLAVNNGNTDHAVDTLLNLASDPMRPVSAAEDSPCLAAAAKPPRLFPNNNASSAGPSAPTSSNNNSPATGGALPSQSMTTPTTSSEEVISRKALRKQFLDAQEREERLLLEKAQAHIDMAMFTSPSLPEDPSLYPENASQGPEELSALIDSPPSPPLIEELILDEQLLPSSPSSTIHSSCDEAKTKLVAPSAAPAGHTLAVNYRLAGNVSPSKGDWIGLFKRGQPSHSKYLEYHKTDGNQAGSLHFTAPGVGTYEFRYFSKGSSVETAKSNYLVVGPQIQLIPVLNEAEHTIKVHARYVIGQKHSGDWIGLFKAGTYHNKEYIEQQPLGKCTTVTFKAPKQPGQYELRYFPSGAGYNDVARSPLIRIEDRDVVICCPSKVSIGSMDKLKASWNIYSVETSSWDWVGLYPLNAVGKRSYVACQYATTNSCTFDIPAKPGDYELRYFSYTTASQVKRSNKISVVVE